MSATYTTPKFMSSLAMLAKENRVSNKEVKAKMAAKLQRAKDIQRQRTLAIKMDKELTKLEQIAAKEEAKQAKMEAKQTKMEAKQAKEQAKQAKMEAKQTKMEAKQAKEQAKQAKEQAKQAKEQAKQAKMEAKHTKQSKTKTQAGNNDRPDIIRSICEKLGAGHIHENQSVIV